MEELGQVKIKLYDRFT